MLKEEVRFCGGSIFEGMLSVRTLIENEISFKDGVSENDRKIRQVLYDRERAKEKKNEFRWIQHRGDELGFEVLLCDREKIDSVTIGNTHGGLIAVCGDRNIPELTADKALENGFYVMLEGIEDPYNFGYALRSLYAAGADGVILGERNWMTAAGVVCRASAGASERLSLFISKNNAAMLMKSRGYKIVCADLRDSVSLYDADLKYPVCLIIGGEKRGISKGLLCQADIRVRIDYGREFAASLSAASAATVVGYEVFRQNKRQP